MKSKMVRKLTALFVAGTMMAAMGTTAMAAGKSYKSDNYERTDKRSKRLCAKHRISVFNSSWSSRSNRRWNADHSRTGRWSFLCRWK